MTLYNRDTWAGTLVVLFPSSCLMTALQVTLQLLLSSVFFFGAICLHRRFWGFQFPWVSNKLGLGFQFGG